EVRRRFAVGLAQRFSAVLCKLDVVIGLERRLEQGAHIFRVVDNQDRRALLGAGRGCGSHGRTGCRRKDGGPARSGRNSISRRPCLPLRPFGLRGRTASVIVADAAVALLGGFMAKSMNAILVVLAAVLLVPALSWAAGLGTITVRSALGQPLDAEIEVVAWPPGEDIQVRLASREAYRDAGVELNSALQGARFAVERRDGRTVIRVRTSQPVNDPFFSVMVELQTPSGRLSRQYTVLVDPAEYRTAAAPTVQQAAAAPVVAPTSPTPAPVRAQTQTPKAAAVSAPAQSAPAQVQVQPSRVPAPEPVAVAAQPVAVAPAPAPVAVTPPATTSAVAATPITTPALAQQPAAVESSPARPVAATPASPVTPMQPTVAAVAPPTVQPAPAQ